MKREEIETLRAKVSCEALLERAGYDVDVRQSTRRAVKYRHGSNIIIVTHTGRGWFDPLSDHKGDVFALAMFLGKLSFASAVDEVALHLGFQLSRPQWRTPPSPRSAHSISFRWQKRRVPYPGSAAWQYLNLERSIPTVILRHTIRQDVLREGPSGSIWAAHANSDGEILGWEERGPYWRGFSSGGSKALFRLGASDATRVCVTEAAIDAMSLAAVEGLRSQTLYVSTGGGWSPATDAALSLLAASQGLTLVAATDANSQGDVYADRLRAIAEEFGCDWQRLRPLADDWNDLLRNREEDIMKTRNRKDQPHT